MALQDFTLNLKANTLALDKTIKSVTDRSYTVKIKADGSSMRTLIQDVLSADGKLKGVVKTMEQVDAQGKVINTTITQNVKTVKSWGEEFSDAFTKVLRFGSVTAIIGAMTQAMREAVQVVKEFDDAFTELAKVSELSGDSLKEYVNGLDEIGERVARTRTDLVDAVTTATKAGFSSEDAKLIAEYSALLQNTFDEQISGADATSILVSQLKAFNMTATDTEQILDKINKVSATQAVSSGDLTSALKVSSSALATYNNTIDETIALITAGTTIMQGRSQQVGRGLQTIASRLVKNEEELAKYGVAIKDSNGNLLSTYEILEDLKPAWDSMSDSERVALGNTLAGVNQYKVLASVMSAFDVAIETNASSLQAHGETMKQNAIYMDSMEAKITTMKAEMQKLVLGDGGLQSFGKTILDIGINILKFANSDVGQLIIKLELATVAITTLTKAMITFASTNFGASIGLIVTEIGSLITGASTLTDVMAALTISMEANPLFWGALAVTGIVLIMEAVDALTVSFDEQVEKLEEAKSAYESAQSELDGLEEQLKNVRDRIDEINSKDELSITDENQLSLLKEQESSLEHQVILQKELAKAAKAEATEEAKKTLSKPFQSEEAFGITIEYHGNSYIEKAAEGTLPQAVDNLTQKISEQQDAIDDLLQKKEQLIKANGDEKGSYDTVEDYLNNTSNEYKELNAQIDEHRTRRDSLRATAAEYVKTMDDAISVADQEDESIKSAIGTMDNYDEVIKRVEHTEGEVETQVDKTSNALVELGDDTEDVTDELEELAKQAGIAKEELVEIASSLSTSEEKIANWLSSSNDFKDSLSDLSSAYEQLKSAVDDYNENGSYSVETLQNLLSMHPEYLAALQDENGQLSINEGALSNVVNALIDEAEAALMTRAQIAAASIMSDSYSQVVTGLGESALTTAYNVSDLGEEALGSGTNASQGAIGWTAFWNAATNGQGVVTTHEQYEAMAKLQEETKKEYEALEDLRENFGKFGDSASGGTKKATSAVKEQKSAVDQLKDKYKDAINFIIKQYDKQIDKIKETKETAIDAVDKQIKALEKEKDARVSAIEAEIKSLERQKAEREKYWEDQLSKLEKENDERQRNIDLQEKQQALALAQQTQVKILKDGKFTYGMDETAVAGAEQDLTETEDQNEYERQKELIEELRDTELEWYDERIQSLEDYKEQVEEYYENQIEQLEEYKDYLEEYYEAQIEALEDEKEAVNQTLEEGAANQQEYWDKMIEQLNSFVEEWNSLVGSLSFFNVSDGGISLSSVGSSVSASAESTGDNKVSAYASGKGSIGDSEIAVVGENPKYKELVIGSKLNNDQGVVMNLKRGSGVVNAGATNTLASIFNALNGQNTNVQPISNSSNKSTSITIGSISLPQVKDGKGFVDYLQNFSNDITQMSFARA